MKVIPQKTVCPRLRNGTDVLPPQRKEVSIIPFLQKNVFMIIAAVIDVIKSPKRERRDISGHDISLHVIDLTGLTLAPTNHQVRLDLGSDGERLPEDLSGL